MQAGRVSDDPLSLREPEAGFRFVELDGETVSLQFRANYDFGGDLNNTRNLMQSLPEILGPTGHVVAIVSGRAFSAGIASLGYLKQAMPERVTVVGAPVGDRLEFWAEGEPVVLPGSGTVVGVATERHNYRTGCPESDCHGPIQRHPIRVESLTPDLHPEVTYADVVGGRDPYLRAALQLISDLR